MEGGYVSDLFGDLTSQSVSKQRTARKRRKERKKEISQTSSSRTQKERETRRKGVHILQTCQGAQLPGDGAVEIVESEVSVRESRIEEKSVNSTSMKV